MANIHPEQIADTHELIADAVIELFEFTPSSGTGTVRLKADNTVTWRGETYEGVPLAFSGDKKSVEGGSSQPTITLGDQRLNLLPLKPLIYDRSLDNATCVRIIILRDDLENDRLVATYEYYRVKQVANYNRRGVTLELATLGDSLNFSMPFRQYVSPDFPTVVLS